MDVTEPMQHAFAVIMAGGSGTRFWPLSRRDRPKQLLPLAPGGQSLLAATVRRVLGMIPAERILVVTAGRLREATAAEVPDVPMQNILAEPIGRNTAPCVGWAAAHVRRRDSDGVLAVLPADHHIGNERAFLELIRAGIFAGAEGDLVTVGVKPNRPETGYGYVEIGEEVDEGVHRARRFVEKPNKSRAEQFFASGRYLWNSGMFFFRADTILQAIRDHLPGLGQALDRFDEAAAAGQEDEAVEQGYAALPAISIDHGVMEKADSVLVIPGDFGWSDLGSWTTTWELAERDAEQNALPPDAVVIDSTGSYAHVPPGKLVALVGVDDLIVVDTEDALLVVPRDRAQDVRRVVDALRERNDRRR